jgi:ATP-dependent Clp protease ATP-binding subunit ClpB
MTSNVGSQFIRAFAENGDEKAMEKSIDGALRATFRPEFLNRIDDIVVFDALDIAAIEPIVSLQLAEVEKRLEERRIKLVVSEAAMERLSIDGFDPVFGARPLKRIIQREIVDRVATEIIEGNVHDGDTVTVGLDKEGNYMSTVTSKAEIDKLGADLEQLSADLAGIDNVDDLSGGNGAI